MSFSIITKTEEEIAIMCEGGKKLAKIKALLKKEIKSGVRASKIDALAEELIRKEGGEPSFKMVPKYKWTTCINVNEGVVHGIPKSSIVFEDGDIVSVDIGMFYKGFHTDTSFSVGLGVGEEYKRFLMVGEEALARAIEESVPGNRVYDISLAIERVIRAGNYNPIKALVGHGVGRNLHEEPQIPCFVNAAREEYPVIPEGAVLAIEVMYSLGSGEVQIENDGWTISTRDGKIAALFEDTVAVTKTGPIVLTR